MRRTRLSAAVLRTQRRRARGAGDRGVALLLVLCSIAILTALAVDFSFNTRVDTALAANARDELRAYYLARSATNLSRLVLNFQYQLDSQAGAAQKAIAGDKTGIAAALGGGAAGMLGGIQLWQILPVESSAITTFIGAAAGPPRELPPDNGPLAEGVRGPASGLHSFGSFEGAFVAEISDEESKLNVNKLNNPGTTGAVALAQLALLWQDPRWDFLFEEENLHHERFKREELLVNLRDFIDENEVQSTIDPTAATTAFVDGFADEGGPYTRYRPTYEPKNALFDSLAELYLVPGFGDRIMTAFGDRLTVYPDINSTLNINTNDPVQQYVSILAAAQDPTQQALHDPMMIQQVLDQIALAKMFGPFMGLSVAQFVTILEGAGIAVNPTIKHSPQQNSFLGDKSQTFTIRATGQVGDVQKTIVSVVRYGQGMGKLLHYREE